MRSRTRLLRLNHCTFLGVHQYNFFNNQIIALQDKIGLSKLPALLKDLVAIRIFEPASKLYSITKKLKFIQTKNQKVVLNEELIEKTGKTLGIKGYYTNLIPTVADDKTIMERYHELYRIVQAFRISKNDLQTRPIFHYKEQPIKLHVLICFVVLVV